MSFKVSRLQWNFCRRERKVVSHVASIEKKYEDDIEFIVHDVLRVWNFLT